MELIVTHSNTDFDGLAAQLAAQKLYPRAIAVLNHRLRDNVAEFESLHHQHLPFVREEDLPERPVSRLIVVDTPTAPSLPGLDDEQIPTLIIDHHPRSQPPRPHEELIHAELGATTSLLVARLIERGCGLSATEATLMLLGIYEDTGHLSYHTTRQEDVAAAAWLLGQGAQIEAVGEFLHRPLTAEQERIFRQIESRMQILTIDGWSILLASAAIQGDTPQLAVLAEKLADLYAPSVIGLAISSNHHGTQIILRAATDAIDAGAIARGFGGGGHAAAAAAFVRGQGCESVQADLERAIRRMLRPSTAAEQLMSRLVRCLPASATMAEASAALERSGHSALPLVDAQQAPRGILMRQDTDTAMRHGLGGAAVSTFMWPCPPTVAPHTMVGEVRRLLADRQRSPHGKLLVTDMGGRLMGIITRADLPLDDAEIHHPNDADELEHFLAPQLLDLLRTAAEQAEQQGCWLYLVGGTVRDMLLGRAQGDLDLLVEGNAIRLAEALATRLGGEVTSYRQFGTATLALDDPQIDTHSLDFVTARSEFYAEPGALPQIEPAGLRHDLRRRDFTINTLAICLNASRYGWRYDLHGGERDLETKQIRVLHSLSFIDDPTRILRAARFAARLGFTIEPHTRALIGDALDRGMLGVISPQRLFNELSLVLHEPQPQLALELLDELGALRAIHPALGWGAAQSRQAQAARAAALGETPYALVVLGLLIYPLADADRAELLARYQPPANIVRLAEDVGATRRAMGQIHNAALADSALDRLLNGIGAAALHTAACAEGGAAAAQIRRYIQALRPARIALNGRDLQQLGFPPGPRIGQMLAELRAAKLDGLVSSRADEEAWVLHIFANPTI